MVAPEATRIAESPALERDELSNLPPLSADDNKGNAPETQALPVMPVGETLSVGQAAP